MGAEKDINISEPNVSVVTICYNAEKEIVKTIESVLAQDYRDYEYIIKDGNSKDSTMDIVRSYLPRFEEKGVRVVVDSSDDDGIYDAMNIAVGLSCGTWVNFMNAGDCFYNETVLTDIFCERHYLSAAALYGDCVEYEYGRFYLFEKRPDMITDVMPFSHQSVFANRTLLSRLPFKTELRYSADYDFLLSAYERGMHFADTGVIVCITTKDGVSSVNYKDMLLESAAIRQLHNMEALSEEEMISVEKELKMKQYVLDHFPRFIKKFIRIIQTHMRHQTCKVVVPPWYSNK